MQKIDPRIKLRHLITFWEVARLRSVSGAADALHISQPAISKTLKELEELLGTPLFDRSKRRIALSLEGEVFFGYAATAVSALRQGLDATKSSPKMQILRIGALPTVSAHVLPSAIARLQAQAPKARTRIITGPNDYLLSLLRTGDVDAILGRMAAPEEMRGLSFEYLYSERVVLAVRPEHPLLHAAELSFSKIAEHQILLPPPHSVIRKSVDRLLRAQGVSDLQGEIETVSTSFARSYTRASDAVWIISEGVVAEDLAEAILKILPLNTQDTLGPVGLTLRTDTPTQHDLSLFISALRSAIEARLEEQLSPAQTLREGDPF